jgi:hypothetical protein
MKLLLRFFRFPPRRTCCFGGLHAEKVLADATPQGNKAIFPEPENVQMQLV